MANDQDDDADFMQKMRKLLDLSKDKVEDLIERLDGDDLLELQDAVTRDDKETAQEIVNSVSVDEDEEDESENDESDKINPLFRGSSATVSSKKKKHHGTQRKDITFQVGDAVLVGSDEVEGTVEKPTAPHGLIGVRIQGKLKMYNKDNVKLDEGVMGMTALPGLARMQELAGIMSTSPAPVATPQVSMEVEPDMEAAPSIASCSERVMAALDELEQALPGVTVAELSTIRARYMEVAQIMNESVKTRKLKL